MAYDGGCGDDDCASQAFLAEDLLDEFLHLAAPFADEPHHDHFRSGIAGHHAEQHALAHAGAGKEAHALAPADRQQAVDRAHAYVEFLGDGFAPDGVHRAAGELNQRGRLDRRAAVEGHAGGIDHEAEQPVAHRQELAGILGVARGGVVLAGQGLAQRALERRHDGAGHQPVRVRDRHQEDAVGRKSNDLGFHRRA